MARRCSAQKLYRLNRWFYVRSLQKIPLFNVFLFAGRFLFHVVLVSQVTTHLTPKCTCCMFKKEFSPRC